MTTCTKEVELTTAKNSSKSVQPTLLSVFNNQRKYDPKSHEAQDLNEAVARLICKDQVSIYMAEKDGFRSLPAKMHPRYQLPGRICFTDVEIPKLYQSTKDKVLEDLRLVQFFSSTTDIWTS